MSPRPVQRASTHIRVPELLLISPANTPRPHPQRTPGPLAFAPQPIARSRLPGQQTWSSVPTNPLAVPGASPSPLHSNPHAFCNCSHSQHQNKLKTRARGVDRNMNRHLRAEAAGTWLGRAGSFALTAILAIDEVACRWGHHLEGLFGVCGGATRGCSRLWVRAGDRRMSVILESLTGS